MVQIRAFAGDTRCGGTFLTCRDFRWCPRIIASSRFPVRIAVPIPEIWALSPYGGTALNDALYDAALYLGRAAPNRRRAVILVSDNEPSDEQTRDVAQVVRAAQQSGTPIYSVKVGFCNARGRFF